MDILVTYSLLSMISERKSNVRSLIEVYQELCESILADNAFKDSGKGLVNDLYDEFSRKFQIKIPYPTLKSILSCIQQQHRGRFELFSDYSFAFDPADYASLRKDIETENRRTQELRDMYGELCREEGIDSGLGIDFFIEINKRELLAYLHRQDFVVPDTPEFSVLETLASVPEYKQLIERLMVGALISSYMDLDIEAGLTSKTLVLDTNFIVSLFDLHSVESRATCEGVLELAKRYGFQTQVLDITVDETRNLLRRKAGAVESIPLFAAQDANSIEHGCFRRRLSGSDLLLYENKIETLLQQKGVKIITGGPIRRIAKAIHDSDIYKKLANRQFNVDGAKHDAMAMEYVKSLRRSGKAEFKDVEALFVTDSHGFLENRISADTKLPYVIRAEELLNIMWLLNPIATSTVSRMNVSRVFSTFLDRRIPGREMLLRLDAKIAALEGLPIDAQDCRDIVINLSLIDTSRLQDLLDAQDETEIRSRIADLAIQAREKSEREKAEAGRRIERLVAMMKHSYEERVTEIQSETEKSIETLGAEKTDLQVQIDEIQKQHADELSAMSGLASVESVQARHDYLKQLQQRDEEELDHVYQERNSIERTIKRRKKTLVFTVLGIALTTSVLLLLRFVVPHWEVLEPVLYVAGILLAIVVSLLGVLNKSFKPDVVFQRSAEMISRRLVSRRTVLTTRIDQLEERIQKTNSDLSGLIV